MSDFKQRLEAEQIELQDRLHKLNGFLGTEKCEGITPDQKTLLIIQSKAMDTYLQCLEARLANLSQETA